MAMARGVRSRLLSLLPQGQEPGAMVALLSELRPRLVEGASLLLAGPEFADSAFAFASVLAEAAPLVGFRKIILADLRRGAVAEADGDGSTSLLLPAREDNGALLLRPRAGLDPGEDLHETLCTLAKMNDLLIIVSDGVMNPGSRHGDPLAMAGLKPVMLMVGVERESTRETVVRAAQRLRRGGLAPFGGIYLRQPGLLNLIEKLLGGRNPRSWIPSSLLGSEPESESASDAKKRSTGRGA